MDQSHINTSMPNFHIIIQRYCDSLVLFTKCIITPTINTTNIIKHKKTRSKRFDNYVNIVEQFNILMIDVILLIKKIILSLNNIFVIQDVKELNIFINILREFLDFLVAKNIFSRLHTIKTILDEKYIKDIKTLDKISNIEFVIIKIFNISIDITSLFIPPVSVLKNAVDVIENKMKDELNKKQQDLADQQIDMEAIIKEISKISIKTEVIESTIKNAFECLITVNSNQLLRVIENLQTEYAELHYIMVFLHAEIAVYKSKKNLLSKVINRFSSHG